MNIIEFVEHVIGDKSISPAQKMALKAAYGLRLTAEESGLFKQTSGLPEYVPREWSEATFILARRTGKSDKLASNVALYEACCREHKLSVGETGVVMIVSSELKRQSRVVFDYCLGKLERSKVLRRMVKRAGLDDFTFHDIRRTFGTRLLTHPERPVDIGTIQWLYGHASMQTTLRYLHPSDESSVEAVELLAEGEKWSHFGHADGKSVFPVPQLPKLSVS